MLSSVRSGAALVLLVFSLIPGLARAQAGKTPRPTACGEVCPPCPPVGPCPPCETLCTVPLIGSATVLLPPPPGRVVPGPGTAATPAPAPVPAPVEPAPGTLELGYFGAFDGTNVMSGGGLRLTGHVSDVWFVDLMGGGSGSDLGGGRSLSEAFGMIGVRVMGAVVPDVLRLFAALDTGFSGRGFAGYRDAPSWGAFAADLGGGLEVGFGAPFTVGFFTDVRLQTRVPFEREAAFVGVAWSAGLAVMWF